MGGEGINYTMSEIGVDPIVPVVAKLIGKGPNVIQRKRACETAFTPWESVIPTDVPFNFHYRSQG